MQNKVMSDGVNTTTIKDDGILVLVFGDINTSLCVLDSSTSFCATPCRSAFTNYYEGMWIIFLLQDNKECDIFSKGNILLSLKNGSQWILKEVKHVPTPSIISIDKLVMLTLILIHGNYPNIS